MHPCFALLDDSSASADAPRSRLYTGLIAALSCTQASELPPLLETMQQALKAGQHAVGLFSYELGAALHGVASAAIDMPLAQVLLFSDCAHLSAQEVAQWLARQTATDTTPAGVAGLHDNVSEAEFAAAIGTVQRYIEAGDTYQVNYTYRLRCDVFGSPAGLYRRLRARQPVPYGACIQLPDGRAILSLSPELFLRHHHGDLTAQPMKGTAPASGDATTDAARAQALASDDKNRAENLMIVDLLRNDLGRIAKFGSVRVPALHEVNRFGNVLQMTSTVLARLRPEATLADVFAAIYPCGSITGAPKKRTMQIIGEIEPAPRGLYTGAIGWFDAPQREAAVGDFCLSVPIRTLLLAAPDADMPATGVRQAEMGVGAGIVYDSNATEEYAECQLKARFLSGLPQEFELFETMRGSAAGCALLERHLARLGASAQYFGFRFDPESLRRTVQQACAALPEGEHRLRLSLNADGHQLRSAPLQPLTEPVRLLLAPDPMHAADLFLRHKTSVRQRYDAAWQSAAAQGAFDMLFVNQHGMLTEGGRSSIFLKLEGRWVTPPLTAGLLPGVMRAALLEDPAWDASERPLTLADLRAAEAVVVCNALRGVLHATVEFDA